MGRVTNNSRGWGGFDWGSWNGARQETPARPSSAPAPCGAKQEDRVESTPKPLLSLSDGPGLLLLAHADADVHDTAPSERGSPGAAPRLDVTAPEVPASTLPLPPSQLDEPPEARLRGSWKVFLRETPRSIEPGLLQAPDDAGALPSPGVQQKALAGSSDAAVDAQLNRLLSLDNDVVLRAALAGFVQEQGESRPRLRELLERSSRIDLQSEWPELALFRSMVQVALAGRAGDEACEARLSGLQEVLGSSAPKSLGPTAEREWHELARALDAARQASRFERSLIEEIPRLLRVLENPQARQEVLARLAPSSPDAPVAPGAGSEGGAGASAATEPPALLGALHRLSAAVELLERREGHFGRPPSSVPPAHLSAQVAGLPAERVERILKGARTEIPRMPGRTTMLGRLGLKASREERLAARADARARFAEDELLNRLASMDINTCAGALRRRLRDDFLPPAALEEAVGAVAALPWHVRQSVSPALVVLLDPRQDTDVWEAALRTLCDHEEASGASFALPRAALAALDNLPRVFAAFGDSGSRQRVLAEWRAAVADLPAAKQPLLGAAERLDLALSELERGRGD